MDAPDDARVRLIPVSAAAASAIVAGERPPDVEVAADYPTEFSTGVASVVGDPAQLATSFIQRVEDDVVVGEIGAARNRAGDVEIGYAVVESLWGQGYATDAVRAFIAQARDMPGVERIVAHTLLERPGSGRVLEKAGFEAVGEVDDEHEGATIRVRRWELRLAGP